MWFAYTYTTTAIDAFSVWNAVGWLLLAMMLYGVWRLWRGMRLDAFERGLRQLREGRSASIAFPARRQTPRIQSGWLQISLLPLMLVSCGAAMLLAQAQRPDDVSRPVTWVLFVAAATWYGTAKWPHMRGVGPLRNYALAGVLSGVSISALLWGFYLAVDTCWGTASYERVTASGASLLWWTAVGAVIGGLMGAFRASRIYAGARGAGPIAAQPAAAEAGELAIQSSPRTRKAAWGAVAVACGASLLFHLSAAPHLYREVDIRYWVWHWDSNYRRGNAVTLTMAPVARQQQLNVLAISLPRLRSDDIAGPYSTGQDMGASSASSAQREVSASAQDRTPMLAPTPKRAIAVGELITSDMLTVEEYYELSAFFVTDRDLLLGQVAAQALTPGQPIRSTQIAGAPAVDTPDTQFFRQQLVGSGGVVEQRNILNAISPLAPILDGPSPEDVIETETVGPADIVPDVDWDSTQKIVDRPIDLTWGGIDDLGPVIIRGDAPAAGAGTEELAQDVQMDDLSGVPRPARPRRIPPPPTASFEPVTSDFEPVPGLPGSPQAPMPPPQVLTLQTPQIQSGVAAAPPEGTTAAPQNQLPDSGLQVTVLTTDGKSYSGRFLAWTDETITLRVGRRVLVFQVETVQSLLTVGPNSTLDVLTPEQIKSAAPAAGGSSDSLPATALPVAPIQTARPTTPVPVDQTPLPVPTTSSPAPPPQPPAPPERDEPLGTAEPSQIDLPRGPYFPQ